MKLTVMFNAVPIHCETVSQAAAVASEVDKLTRGTRSNGARHQSDEGTAAIFSVLMGLGAGGRKFAKPLVQNRDWLSVDKFSSDLGFKKTSDIEGAISSMKSFLKHRGIDFSEVFEEKTGPDGRFFRIRPAVFDLVKKALEVQ